MDSHFENCILTGTAEHPASSNVSCPEPEIPPTQAPILKQPNKPQRQRSAKCHVFGCKHNLVKAYDKKARTCSFHRKAAHVEIDQILHRFCQQCSRFHPLAEFDGARRNCRNRLQQHNRRQRRMRLLRRPDSQDDIREQYSAPCVTDPELLAPESPDLSEIGAGDGFLLSSVDIDSLFGPQELEAGQQILDLLEISSAISAADGRNLLMAEDVWNDQWFKPALGHPEDVAPSPFLYPHGA